MKIQRRALDKSVALPGAYDSFFSFPVSKGGYSGVAVYVNSRIVTPQRAEEGLAGIIQPKPPLSPEERITKTHPSIEEMKWFPDENGQVPKDFKALDSEGRALVIDFKFFVLINLYCPATTSEERLPYKMNFHLLLEERVRQLLTEGREVIVVGDINIAAGPIDHGEGALESTREGFWESPARGWFKSWLDPEGPMVDVVRRSWPGRKGMYTCKFLIHSNYLIVSFFCLRWAYIGWNTKTSARESNYGSRIDYVLLSRGLLPWFKHGDIQPSIKGSDHCPVFIDLHDEITLPSGEVLTLREAMGMYGKPDDGTVKRELPRLAAKFWPEVAGKQTLLSSFFAKPGVAPPIKPAGLKLPTQSSREEEKQMTEAQQQQSGIPALEDTHPAEPPPEATPTATTTPIDVINTADQPILPQFPEPSLEPSSHRSTPTKKRKLTTIETTQSSKEPRKLPSLATSSKKPKVRAGQTQISSFFTKPAASTSKPAPPLPSSSTAPIEILDSDNETADAPPESLSQLEADYRLACSLADEPAELPSSQSTKSASQSKTAWNFLLTPLEAPRCTVHNELAKSYVVNKPGANKGKTFFLCSRCVLYLCRGVRVLMVRFDCRPLGAGYDMGKAKRRREEVDMQYRCNFFKWASEVRKDSLQNER